MLDRFARFVIGFVCDRYFSLSSHSRQTWATLGRRQKFFLREFFPRAGCPGSVSGGTLAGEIGRVVARVKPRAIVTRASMAARFLVLVVTVLSSGCFVP
jgi:hypothetical protein